MDDMTEILTKLKSKVIEPKIYSLVVRSNKLVILHMGVYHTLDEAFAAVKQRALEETKTSNISALNLDMWMWETMPANTVIAQLFGADFPGQFIITEKTPEDLSTDDVPEAKIGTSEYVRRVYDMRNELMKRIIDSGDVEALEEAKSILTKAELKLIREKITPKT